MKISAREKRRAPVPVETIPNVAVNDDLEQAEAGEGLSEVIPVQIDKTLFQSIQNSLISAHTAQDFTYVSASDLIRAAVRAYKDGMPLTETVRPGKRKSITVRVEPDLKELHQSLPNRLKSQIIERAVRTFMKNRLQIS